MAGIKLKNIFVFKGVNEGGIIMRLVKAYIKMNLKRSIEYRGNFIIGFIGLLIINISSILILYIIISNFEDIAGWTYWENIFNYALFLTSLGLHKVIFQNIGNLEDYIVDGRFDRLMLRPVSPFAQIILEVINIEEITDFFLGIIGLSISSIYLKIRWSASNIIWLVLSIINGAVVFTLILSIISTLSFWLYRVYPILYGTTELQEAVQNYPIIIYSKPLKFIVTYVLPYAAVNYFPSLILLGKTENTNNIIIYIFSIDIVLGVIQKKLWNRGIKNYRSSGT